MEDKCPSQQFFEKFADRVVRFRWLVALGIIAMSAFFFTQLPKLTFNSSFEVWFFENDPAMTRLESFKQAFGNSNFVYIVVETDQVFEPETAAILKNMASRLEASVPYLKSLTWVGNAENIVGEDDIITIQRLLEVVPQDAETLAHNAAMALGEDEFVDRYITADGKAAGILLEFDPFPEEGFEIAPSTEVAEAVFKVLDEPEFANFAPMVVGDPIFEAKYTEIANEETPKLFMLCLAVQALILLVFNRTLRSILVPLFIVSLSFLWVLGSIALLGFELDLMIIGLPVLLICISIGDSMHAMATFSEYNSHGMSRRPALVKAMGVVGLACFVTSVTTAAGFLAFSSAPVKPFLRMGIYMPLGVMYAYLLTVLLVPVIFSFGKQNTRKARPNRLIPLVQRWMDRLCDVLIAYPKQLAAIFILLMAASLAGTTMLQVETNTTRYLHTKVPLRQHMDHIDERMAGSASLEIVVDSGRPDGIKDALFLSRLGQLEDALKNEPLVNKAISISTVLKKIRRAMHNGDEHFYALPENSESVAEYLAMYEISGGENLNKLVSLDYSKARLTLQTKALSSKDTRYLVAQALDQAETLFGGEAVVYPAGTMDIAKSLNDNMGASQRSSILLAFVFIGIVMMIALRSVKLGALSLLPNLLPIFATLGLMGFVGIDMDTVLMTVCGMVIGVSIDDTTHFFVHFRQAFASTGDYEKSLRLTLREIGYPILFTTITLCLGFLALVPSVLIGWVRIGYLAPYAFVWALIGDLIFAGPMLLLLKPLGKGCAVTEEKSALKESKIPA